MQPSSAIYYHKPISRATLIYFLLPLKMPEHVNFTISLIIFFFIIREWNYNTRIILFLQHKNLDPHFNRKNKKKLN